MKIDGAVESFVKSRAGWCAVILLALAVCLGMWLELRYSDIPFDTVMWRLNPAERSRMTRSLQGSNLLLDCNEAKVVQLLGTPDSMFVSKSNGSRELLYHVGASTIDERWFGVILRNGRVVNARVRPD